MKRKKAKILQRPTAKEFLMSHVIPSLVKKNAFSFLGHFDNFIPKFTDIRKALYKEKIFLEIIPARLLKFVKIPALSGPLLLISSSSPDLTSFVTKLQNKKLFQLNLLIFQNCLIPYNSTLFSLVASLKLQVILKNVFMCFISHITFIFKININILNGAHFKPIIAK